MVMAFCASTKAFVSSASGSSIHRYGSDTYNNVPLLVQAMTCVLSNHLSGLILGLRPANKRRRYIVTMSLIGWAQI